MYADIPLYDLPLYEMPLYSSMAAPYLAAAAVENYAATSVAPSVLSDKYTDSKNVNVTAVAISAASTSTFLNSNIALHRPAFASSKEGEAYSASAAFDGNTNTRWASSWNDPQWIYVDLGSSYTITSAILNWEGAYGKNYEIQISDNATQWQKIYSTVKSSGGLEKIQLTGNGRYVRLYINERATEYGDSLFEIELYGANNSVKQSPQPVLPVTGVSTVNKAKNRPAVASSFEDNVWNAQNAVDDNSMTRWSSAFSDPQWIYVDLGSVQVIQRVVLKWEYAFAKAYEIQVSDDKSSWTTVYTTTNGDGDVDDIPVNTKGRYIRMYGTQRVTEYGYSLWGFEVY